MVMMNGPCPPLTSTNDNACMVDKKVKAASTFDNYGLSLHLFVSFYIAAENLGTIWVPKY